MMLSMFLPLFLATSFSVLTIREAEWDDTEVVTNAARSPRSLQIRRASSTRRSGTRCASPVGAWILRVP